MSDPVISTQHFENENTANPGRNTLINSTGTNISTTRTVRVNWLKFLFYSWKRISILSKLVVSCNVLLVIAQVFCYYIQGFI